MTVTLESKFDIGDQVFVVNSYCGRVSKATVADVRLTNGKFLYAVDDFIGYFDESELEWVQ